jgi:hypothetical protein
VIVVAPLLLAALAAAGDPCVVTDDVGRSFFACFDPGNRLEGSAAWRGASGGPSAGGALDLATAFRWRSDRAGPGGSVEWLRDQAFLDGGALVSAGRVIGAELVAWRGVFVRHLAEPFIFLPGPRPTRLRFPFDVGVAVEAGGVRWDRTRERLLDVEVLRSTLLLDLVRLGLPLRRAAFGPELSYGLGVERALHPVHRMVPFTGGAIDLRAETADGLWVASLGARAGAVLRVPGGWQGYAEGTLLVERVLLAVNDEPVAAFLSLARREGPEGSRLEAVAGLRLALGSKRAPPAPSGPGL